jgi:hypothetical protein
LVKQLLEVQEGGSARVATKKKTPSAGGRDGSGAAPPAEYREAYANTLGASA